MVDRTKCSNVLPIYLFALIGAGVAGCSSIQSENGLPNLKVIDAETRAGIAGARITVFPITPLIITQTTKAGGNCALRCRMQSIVKIAINAPGYIGIEMTRDEIARALNREGTAIIGLKKGE